MAPDDQELLLRYDKSYPWIVWPGITRCLTTQAKFPAIERSLLKRTGTRSRDGSSGQKIKCVKWIKIYILERAVSRQNRATRRVPTVTVDRVKISTRSTPNRSPTRSSSASTQVHREECYPPYRRVHKVRKESCTETEYPLR